MTTKAKPATKRAAPQGSAKTTPKPPKFNKDGSIELDLGKAGQVKLTQPTIGDIGLIFSIEESIDADTPRGSKNDWQVLPRFYVEVLDQVYGTKVNMEDLPGWTVNPAVKLAVINHFFSVPFDLPPSALPAPATVAPAPRPAVTPTPTPEATGIQLD